LSQTSFIDNHLHFVQIQERGTTSVVYTLFVKSGYEHSQNLLILHPKPLSGWLDK